MGTDNIFKKRKAQRASRKHDIISPKPNSYLIVTEGAKTEPLYFSGFTKAIKAKEGGVLEVVSVPYIEIHGEGRCTISLINKTDEIVNKSKIIFQNVWIVFDKDDFADFDEAIKLAKEKGYKVAWCNQSFEYWLYLHFNYSDAALHRNVWYEKLNELFRENNYENGKYQKNYENIFELVSQNNGVETAIRNAKRRMSKYIEGSTKPSEYDPGTSVHQLVLELKAYIE